MMYKNIISLIELLDLLESILNYFNGVCFIRNITVSTTYFLSLSNTYKFFSPHFMLLHWVFAFRNRIISIGTFFSPFLSLKMTQNSLAFFAISAVLSLEETHFCVNSFPNYYSAPITSLPSTEQQWAQNSPLRKRPALLSLKAWAFPTKKPKTPTNRPMPPPWSPSKSPRMASSLPWSATENSYPFWI